jgi:hypothetical protein
VTFVAAPAREQQHDGQGDTITVDEEVSHDDLKELLATS